MDRLAMSRRDALKSSLALPLAAAGISALTGAANAPTGGSRALVAYLSRSGNTRLIARQIRRATNADLFEIETAQPYPEDYEKTVALAQRQKEAGTEPPLTATVTNMERYDTVFLGFPIWGMSAPAPIRSFLSAHDLSGKTLITFITHGGYGLGDSREVVARHAPQARLEAGFSLERPQERQTLASVTEWLGRATR